MQSADRRQLCCDGQYLRTQLGAQEWTTHDLQHRVLRPAMHLRRQQRAQGACRRGRTQSDAQPCRDGNANRAKRRGHHIHARALVAEHDRDARRLRTGVHQRAHTNGDHLRLARGIGRFDEMECTRHHRRRYCRLDIPHLRREEPLRQPRSRAVIRGIPLYRDLESFRE